MNRTDLVCDFCRLIYAKKNREIRTGWFYQGQRPHRYGHIRTREERKCVDERICRSGPCLPSALREDIAAGATGNCRSCTGNTTASGSAGSALHPCRENGLSLRRDASPRAPRRILYGVAGHSCPIAFKSCAIFPYIPISRNSDRALSLLKTAAGPVWPGRPWWKTGKSFPCAM